jgi:hypothetical protein
MQYSAALMLIPDFAAYWMPAIAGHDDTGRPPQATSESCGLFATTHWLRPFALAA